MVNKVYAGMVKTKNRKSVIHTGMLRVLEQKMEKGKTMTDREKLIALLCEAMLIYDRINDDRQDNPFHVFADHLLANGVTIPVRCKDCFANGCCSVQIDLDMGDEGYCSKGRKDNR